MLERMVSNWLRKLRGEVPKSPVGEKDQCDDGVSVSDRSGVGAMNDQNSEGGHPESHSGDLGKAELLLTERKFEEAVEHFRLAHEREASVASLSRYCKALALADYRDKLDEVALAGRLEGLQGKPWTYLHDLDVRECRIMLEVLLDICQTPEAIVSLCRAVQFVLENDIPGDFVECGVYRGASAICIIRVLQSFGVTDRRVWLYDTFEGMPEPGSIDRYMDTAQNNEETAATWHRLRRTDGSGGSDWVRCSIDVVKSAVLQTGYPEENIIFVKGLVEETIPEIVPDSISLLRLDTDFYQSTRHELEHLYPRLVGGGFLIIDDYGAFQGAREATDEYLRQNKLPLFLSRVDEHVRLVIKPQTSGV